jgi:hypothetical protein
MSTATAQLLCEFEKLSPLDQKEFSYVIFQKTAEVNHGDIADEELTSSAARIFAMFDEEEQHAQTR